VTVENPWGPPPPPIPHETPRYEDGEPLEDYEIDVIETRYEHGVAGTKDWS
jgi:hypothetical protein